MAGCDAIAIYCSYPYQYQAMQAAWRYCTRPDPQYGKDARCVVLNVHLQEQENKNSYMCPSVPSDAEARSILICDTLETTIHWYVRHPAFLCADRRALAVRPAAKKGGSQRTAWHS